MPTRTSASRPRLAVRLETLEDRSVPAILVGLTTASHLVTFDSAAPGTLGSDVAVTGLQAGESLVGIDYRPANGVLYGVGSTSRIYTLNPSTGVATAVSATPFSPALSGTNFGVDFNPQADKLRVVSNTGQNLRINQLTGAVAATDTNLAYDPATYDAVVGGTPPAPSVVSAAYTKNASQANPPAVVTTEYVIDSANSLLSTAGGPDSDPSPNGGVLFPVGQLGFTPGSLTGFDIETGTDKAFAATGNKLYAVNLTTAATDLLGTVGGGVTLADVTIGAPVTGAGAFSFASPTVAFDPSRGPVALTVTRTGGASLPATVDFKTADGTATAGSDYLPTSGTLSFAAGQTSQTVYLLLPGGPAAVSPAETFTVTLSNATGGATLGANPTVTATIPAVTEAQSPASRFFATGAGQGAAPVVNVYNAVTGAPVFNFTPFETTFTGGVTVATGDVDGDGTDDIVVGTGVGGAPRVVVYSGATRAPIADFFAYESTFRGGVNVSTGDVNGDGFADLLIGSGVGGGPRVRVLSGTDLTSAAQTTIADFFAYENTFRGGVNVGSGELTGDKFADIIAGSGFGGGPRIRVFSGGNLVPGPDQTSVADYFAYDSSFRNGVNVASGDVDGNGRADVISGPGLGGGPDVRVFMNATPTPMAAFFAFENTFTGGGRVASTDLGGDGVDDILVAGGPGRAPEVRAFNVQASGSSPTQVLSFNAYDAAFTGGVYVG